MRAVSSPLGLRANCGSCYFYTHSRYPFSAVPKPINIYYISYITYIYYINILLYMCTRRVRIITRIHRKPYVCVREMERNTRALGCGFPNFFFSNIFFFSYGRLQRGGRPGSHMYTFWCRVQHQLWCYWVMKKKNISIGISYTYYL